ncbi:MAG: DinB family protein [Thermomicrobiales bacterium]
MEPVVAKIAEQFKVVHQQLRDEVRGLSIDELNWKPASDTNSIAALVVHTLGSEAEVLRVAANVTGSRDRDAEFLVTADNAEELIRQIDHADAYIDDLAARITADDLAALRERGGRAPQTSLHWLLTNYGHAREHLAHIQLTKQLYATATS